MSLRSLMPATVRSAARPGIGRSPHLSDPGYSTIVKPCFIANRLACARFEAPIFE
jgi:hypothetical protein